jgi:hypothetical protein
MRKISSGNGKEGGRDLKGCEDQDDQKKGYKRNEVGGSENSEHWP